ncbi:hypothetical protein [Georgenia sp. MJ170]|uniref:hypothetical protein n=1 Tax=Georgenia sunbinii TaxID=3117728 RepID=UPI002F26DACB
MRSGGRRVWSWLGIAALIVLNIVLITLLLTRPGVPAGTSTAAPSSPSSARPSEPATDPADDGTAERPEKVGSALPAPAEPEQLRAEPAERILVAATEQVAWRATVGQCEDPGTLEHTVDGGQTWRELPNELAPLSRIRVLGAATIFAIGGGVDCEPVYLSSSTAGVSWSTNNQFLTGSWYLDPADRSRMGAPVGTIDAPCEAVELVGTDASSAGVLCTDGSLNVTADGGATWQETTPELDAVTVGASDEGYVLVGSHEVCEEGVALAFTDLTGEAPGEPTCAPAPAEDASELTAAAAGSSVWLWAADEVLVSVDGGLSW